MAHRQNTNKNNSVDQTDFRRAYIWSTGQRNGTNGVYGWISAMDTNGVSIDGFHLWSPRREQGAQHTARKRYVWTHMKFCGSQSGSGHGNNFYFYFGYLSRFMIFEINICFETNICYICLTINIYVYQMGKGPLRPTADPCLSWLRAGGVPCVRLRCEQGN